MRLTFSGNFFFQIALNDYNIYKIVLPSHWLLRLTSAYYQAKQTGQQDHQCCPPVCSRCSIDLYSGLQFSDQ